MVALCSRCGHYIFILWFLLSSSQQSQIGCLPYFYTWCGLSANLGCRSETCCTRLDENTGRKKSPKIGTIFATKALSTIRKKLVKHQYLPHMSLQYGELRPTSAWDLFASLGHPSKFQRVSRLGSVTARHSSSGHQSKFVALNRVRHLYLAGWPSRWALAYILVLFMIWPWLLHTKACC